MSDQELEQVLLMFNRGRHVEAEDRVRRVLSERPEDEWALRLLAACLVAQGRCDDARVAAERACQAKPAEPLCWIQLANVHIEMNDPPAAVRAAQRAVEVSPHYPRAHDALARAYLTEIETYRPRTAFDPESALAAAETAVRLQPDDMSFRTARAWALVLLERTSDAEHEYHRMLTMRPDSISAVNGLGWLEIERHPIIAARYFKAALAMAPQSLVIKINLHSALRSWIYRMIWIWLWGGLAVSALRWFAPPAACYVALVSIPVTCLVGTGLMVRRFPRGTLRAVWSIQTITPRAPLLVRLLGCCVIALTAALASTPVSLAATGLLVVVALVIWKVNFTDIDRHIAVWAASSRMARNPLTRRRP